MRLKSVFSFHHRKGIIFHLPATLSLPNFFSYHPLLVEAVIDRFADTKTNAVNMVVLTHAPFGADRNANDR